MREIAARSRSVFEAAGSLQDLHRSMCSAQQSVKDTREHVRPVPRTPHP